MYWKIWLTKYAPEKWSTEKKLMYINFDVPEVTLEDVQAVLDEHAEQELNNLENQSPEQ